MHKPDLSQIWPEWQIEGEPIGEGQFGKVYKAIHQDNLVTTYSAVKIISVPKNSSDLNSLSAQGITTERAVTAYLQNVVNDCVSEIQLMESLKGTQHIVSVEDYKIVKKVDQIGWDIYIRMELLTPLTEYIKENPLDDEDVIKLGCDICTALEMCSKRGIIHRDIKPENIFVNEFGDFKLGDFGIARSLEGKIGNLSIKGTPSYMAPEVANSKDYDARVDTYSLGIVLYLFLNRNRLPFVTTKEQANDPNAVAEATRRRLRGEKVNPPSQASSKLASVVLRACAYNPNARFQSAAQMKQALLKVRDHAIQPRRPWRVLLIVMSILLLLGGATAALFFSGVIPALSNLQITYQDPNDTTLAEIKKICNRAEELVESGNIEGAIKMIREGLEDYPNSEELDALLATYKTMQANQVVANTLAEAKALADQGDYYGAIAVLQAAINSQGSVQEYLDACAQYEELERNTAVNGAQQLAAHGDYLGAILAVDSIMATLGENEELLTWRAELEVSYVDQVVQSAETLLLIKDYDTADQELSEALKYFPDNKTLISIYARVQHSRPVYLLSEVIPYKTVGRYNAKSTVTMGGKSYENGFTVMGYGAYNEGNQVMFNLDGDYSMISFTAGIVSTPAQNVTFLFHADGELVYKFTMRNKESPSSHVFNIVGCKQFVISVSDGSTTSERSGTFALGDIMVTRSVASLNKVPAQLTDNQVYLLNETKPYITPSRYADSAILSMGGKNYANGFSCMGYGPYNVGNLTYFNLDQNYSKITFTAGLVLDQGLNVSYKFYTDGVLAYELKLGESDLATTHSFSVEGCRQLLISVCDGKTTPDASGTYGIAEIIMDKSQNYKAPSEDKSYTLKEGEYFLLDTIVPHLTPTRYSDSNLITMGGKNYTDGFSCMGHGQYNKGNQTAFNLDGKYKTISFTAGIVLDRGRKVTFRFQADGKVVYEFSLQAGDLPTDHSFSVEGCSELVISVFDGQTGADSSGTYALANIVIAE